MRVAIVGAGISGLVAARGLHRRAEITVFEAETRLGGHSHTVNVDDGGVARALDIGFLVFNPRDYPRYTRLIETLGVGSAPTDMSFSVRCGRSGIEYGGATVGARFARWRNAFDPAFWRMLGDIARFYREGSALAARLDSDATIEELVRAGGFSRAFVDLHLHPLGSALWSAPRAAFARYPARFVLEFFARHDLLEMDLRRRVRWRTIAGGSARVIERLSAPFADRIRRGDPVRGVRRNATGVRVRSAAGEAHFDHVVFACRGDDALRLLEDPLPAERAVLGAARSIENEVVLHTDTRLLPRSRWAWSSWNYHVRPDRDLATVTYDLSRLQGITSARRYLVTLNESDAVDPAQVLGRFRMSHPEMSAEWIRASARADEVQGVRGTWFCGAYWGSGFHEDGVRSGEAVVAGLTRAVAPPATEMAAVR